MTVRIIGFGCAFGEDCNPGRTARPVYMDSLCWPCWASHRVVDAIRAQRLECCVCGGDPVGGEVQPVFGAGQEDTAATGHASLPEPLMFCRACARDIREKRANATQITEPIDSLELWWRLDSPDDLPAAA